MIPVEVVQAVCMLMTWSLLYKENKIYRVGEAMTIGLFLGVILNYAVDVLYKRVYTPLFVEGRLLSGVLVVTILGILFYTRFFRPVWWISRWPVAILGGVGSAIAVRGVLGPMILKQLHTLPVTGQDPLTTLNRVILPLATFTALCQFIFTKKQRGILGGLAFVGRLFLVVAFGFMLGTFLMSNIAFAINNMSILAVPPGAYVTLVAIILLLIALVKDWSKAKAES
jgi:hypothetical protein